MNKRFIRQLAEASFTNNTVNEETVGKIVSLLSKKILKEYVKQLKIQEKLHTIVIDVPQSSSAYDKQLQQAFPEKKVIVRNNTDLILGMRIKNNDDIYELSLKNSLEAMKNHLEQSYDR